MTQTATTAERPVWCWRFDDAKQLATALWEYNVLSDGVQQRTAPGGKDCPYIEGVACEDCEHSGRCAAERHTEARLSEIDACMEIMRETYPRYWRLLDLYYRQDLGHDPRGWLLVLKRDGSRSLDCPKLPSGIRPRCACGLVNEELPEDTRLDIPKCRALVELWCTRDQKTFKADVKEAVERLFAIHKRRWGK